MARYTVTLSKKYPTLATYSQSSVQWVTDGYLYGGEWQPAIITTPKWKSGAKKFTGYWYGSTPIITSDGFVIGSSISQNVSITESWSGSPIAILNDGSSIVGELVYDGGLWYSDYKNKIVLTQFSPMPIPSKTNYKFLGIFSTNASSGGTKYVDENGNATTSLVNLAPTSDKTFYYRFQLVTKTITISAADGTWSFKKFYQKISDGVYTRNSNGENEIAGMPVPVRECYRWGGLRKSSSSTSTLYANPDGTFTEEFLARSSADATVYGNFWTQVSYKITVNANSGTAPQASYYLDKANGGVYADDLITGSELTTLPIPTRKGYHFLGYYSAASGGTQYVSSDGTISSTLKTIGKAVTIYAHWRAASVTITLNNNGGIGTSNIIYYDTTDAVYFDVNSQPISDVDIPTYAGNVFDGYYDAENGGSKVIDTDGTIIAQSPASDATWYAHWIIGKSNIHINFDGGEGGTEIFYCDIASRKFYLDADMTQEITAIALPHKFLYNTQGAFDADDTQVIYPDGVISSSFNPSEEDVYITVKYTRKCWQITLDPNGGNTELLAIYYTQDKVFADEALTTEISSIQAFRTGYTLTGFSYSNTQVIDSSGNILDVAKSYNDDYTATASWTKNTYTLTFVSSGSLPWDSKQVLFGAQIGSLPTPTWKGHKFLGWSIDGIEIMTTTVYNWGTDKTAIAKWETAWGYVQDYWGLGSTTLIPIRSDDGASGQMIYTDGGSAQYQVLPNPTVTYMVIGQTNFSATLGGVGLGAYMITNVQVNTTLGQPPTITVSGVANEGQRAVNNYPIQVTISPRHRAQRLGNAIVGGGELQSCTYTAKCDPVVVYGATSSGIAPIASDVVHGVVTIQGTTAAYNMESAPTSANGYTITGLSQEGEHIGYKAFNITVEQRI